MLGFGFGWTSPGPSDSLSEVSDSEGGWRLWVGVSRAPELIRETMERRFMGEEIVKPGMGGDIRLCVVKVEGVEGDLSWPYNRLDATLMGHLALCLGGLS